MKTYHAAVNILLSGIGHDEAGVYLDELASGQSFRIGGYSTKSVAWSPGSVGLVVNLYMDGENADQVRRAIYQGIVGKLVKIDTGLFIDPLSGKPTVAISEDFAVCEYDPPVDKEILKRRDASHELTLEDFESLHFED
jgi:hypothetical protein